jgi:hypothetical protein
LENQIHEKPEMKTSTKTGMGRENLFTQIATVIAQNATPEKEGKCVKGISEKI